MSLSESCILKKDVKNDQVILMDDVTLPEGRLSNQLYEEQKLQFKQ